MFTEFKHSLDRFYGHLWGATVTNSINLFLFKYVDLVQLYDNVCLVGCVIHNSQFLEYSFGWFYVDLCLDLMLLTVSLTFSRLSMEIINLTLILPLATDKSRTIPGTTSQQMLLYLFPEKRCCNRLWHTATAYCVYNGSFVRTRWMTVTNIHKIQVN
jgi:hypothetical protein